MRGYLIGMAVTVVLVSVMALGVGAFTVEQRSAYEAGRAAGYEAGVHAGQDAVGQCFATKGAGRFRPGADGSLTFTCERTVAP